MTERTLVRVTGDWLPEDHEGYDAVVAQHRWNGWACPRFTEEAARQVVADQQRLVEEYGDETDVLEIVRENPLTISLRQGPAYKNDEGYPFEAIITADEDGLFDIGGFGWCWIEVENARTV